MLSSAMDASWAASQVRGCDGDWGVRLHLTTESGLTTSNVVPASHVLPLLPFALMCEKGATMPEGDADVLFQVVFAAVRAFIGPPHCGEELLPPMLFVSERLSRIPPSGDLFLERTPHSASMAVNNLMLLVATAAVLQAEHTSIDVPPGCSIPLSTAWALVGRSGLRKARCRRWLDLFRPDLQGSFLCVGADTTLSVGSSAPALFPGLHPRDAREDSVNSEPPIGSFEVDSGDGANTEAASPLAPMPAPLAKALIGRCVTDAQWHEHLLRLLGLVQDVGAAQILPIQPRMPTPEEYFRGTKRARDEPEAAVAGSVETDESMRLFDLLASRGGKDHPKPRRKLPTKQSNTAPLPPLAGLRAACLKQPVEAPTLGTNPEVTCSSRRLWATLRSHSKRDFIFPVCSLVAVVSESAPRLEHQTINTSSSEDDEHGPVTPTSLRLAVVKVDFVRRHLSSEACQFVGYIISISDNGLTLLTSVEITEAALLETPSPVRIDGADGMDPDGKVCSFAGSLSSRAPLLQAVHVCHEDHIMTTDVGAQQRVLQREKDATRYVYHTYDQVGAPINVEEYVPPAIELDPEGYTLLEKLLGKTGVASASETGDPSHHAMLSTQFSVRLPPQVSTSDRIVCVVLPASGSSATPHYVLHQQRATHSTKGICQELRNLGLFGRNSVSAQNARSAMRDSRVADCTVAVFGAHPTPTTSWDAGLADFLRPRSIHVEISNGVVHRYLREQLFHCLSGRKETPIQAEHVVAWLRVHSAAAPLFSGFTRRKGLPRLVDSVRVVGVVYDRLTKGLAPNASIRRLVSFLMVLLAYDQLPERGSERGSVFGRRDTSYAPLRQLLRSGVLLKLSIADAIRNATNYATGATLSSLLNLGESAVLRGTENAVPRAGAESEIVAPRAHVDGHLCLVKDPSRFGAFMDATFYVSPMDDPELVPLFAEDGCHQLVVLVVQVCLSRLASLRFRVSAEGVMAGSSVFPLLAGQLIEVHILQWAASRFVLSADPSTKRIPFAGYPGGLPIPAWETIQYGSQLCDSFCHWGE